MNWLVIFERCYIHYHCFSQKNHPSIFLQQFFVSGSLKMSLKISSWSKVQQPVLMRTLKRKLIFSKFCFFSLAACWKSALQLTEKVLKDRPPAGLEDLISCYFPNCSLCSPAAGSVVASAVSDSNKGEQTVLSQSSGVSGRQTSSKVWLLLITLQI